jgi:hypothetical protein
MELARETWTDERLDDLVRHTDEGFARLDNRLEREIDSVRAEMRELRGEMNARFDAIDRRFDSLQRMMLLFYGSLVLTLIGVVAALT